MAADSTLLRSLDEDARRRFESAWRSGQPEPIERFLPPPDHLHYLPTLEELVAIEMEFTWKAWQPRDAAARPASLEDYLHRFPRLALPDSLRRLIRHEFAVRVRQGEAVEPDEYRARFPDLVRDLGLEHLVLTYRPPGGGGRPEPSPGERLGRYRLCAHHARGGFGLIWRAADDALGREVALKQLSGELQEEPTYRLRFLFEARIAAQLQHPGIVPVYDIGPDENEPYYTMKLVRGRTLGEAIRRFHADTRTPGERAVERLRLLESFLAVARAMAYAHSCRVIHRDLKPDNILLGDFGETVVVDWGLAKVLEKEPPPDTPVAVRSTTSADQTQVGTILGTPAYMAPEQASGRVADIDERSDIYALGAILYQMLTGRPAYRGTDSMEVLRQLLAEAPPRPRSIDPSIPRSLEAVCLRAMARQREDRYPSADELARDLERHLADEPVSAHRERWSETLRRWSRRHRTAVISGIVALVLALASIVGGLLQWERADRKRQQQAYEYEQSHLREEAGRINRERERCARSESLARTDEALGQAQVQAARFRNAAELFAQAAERLSDAEPLLEMRVRLLDQRRRAHQLAEFYQQGDDAWFLAGEERDQLAREAIESALTELAVFADGPWPERLPTDELTDTQARHLRRDTHRLLLLLAVLRLKPVADDIFSLAPKPATAAACRSALIPLARAREFEESWTGQMLENLCHRGTRELDELKQAPVPKTATDYFFVGWAHLLLASARQAAAARQDIPHQALVRFLEKLDLPGNDHPTGAAARFFRLAAQADPQHYWHHFMLGLALVEEGDHRGAGLAFDACILLRPEYPRAYEARGWQGLLQAAPTKDPDLQRRALADYRHALELAPNDPWTYWSRFQAFVYLRQTPDALAALHRALELDPEGFAHALAKEPPPRSWKGAGALDEARKNCEGLTNAAPADAEAQSALAEVLLVLGRPEDAARSADKALQVRADLPRALAVRGALALKRQDYDAALKDFEPALRALPRDYLSASGRARACEALHQPGQALAAYDYLLKTASVDWQRQEANLGRSRAFTALGRTDEAEKARKAATHGLRDALGSSRSGAGL